MACCAAGLLVLRCVLCAARCSWVSVCPPPAAARREARARDGTRARRPKTTRLCIYFSYSQYTSVYTHSAAHDSNNFRPALSPLPLSSVAAEEEESAAPSAALDATTRPP